MAALGRVEELRKLFTETESLPPQSGLVPLVPRMRGLSPGFIMVESGLELRAHGYVDDSRPVLDQAIAWYQKHVAATPASEELQAGLGAALYAAGRFSEAEAVFNRLARRAPNNVDYVGHVALIAAHQGRRGDAAAGAMRLAAMRQPYLFGRATLWRARLAAQLGDLDQAIIELRQSRVEGNPFGIEIHRDVDLEPLRNVPAFREFATPDA